MTDAAPLDLVVVGAGLSGLAAAWRAHAAGKSVMLLEASPRVGGVIRTERLGPYRVERAAASFPSTARHLLAIHGAIPAAPGLLEPPSEANAQMLLTRRGLVALERSPARLVRSGLLPAGGVLRVALEPFLGRRRSRRPESAYDFVRRRFGRAAAERLLRPMTLGIYGSDPRDLGAGDAFPSLVRAEREHGSVLRGLRQASGTAIRRVVTFSGGMESFPRAIAAALGDRVRTGAAVASVEPEGRALAVRGASGAITYAREVVLATTAPEQARLARPLSTGAAGILLAVRYVPMVVVAVGLPPGGAPPLPRAFGFLRAPGSKARILGASFPSVLDPTAAPEGHALVTAFLGGGLDPGVTGLGDDEVASIVLRDLARALRGPLSPDLVSVHRWPRAIPVLSPAHGARMAEAQRLLSPHGIRLSGSHVTGVSIDSCCAPVPGETPER